MADFTVSTRAGAGNTRPNDLFQVVDSTTGIPYVVIYGGSGGGTPVAPSGVTVTQANGTLTAATSASILALNASRKFAAIMNTGTGTMTVSTAATAVAGAGWVILPNGCLTFDGVSVPTNALAAISTPGTTYSTMEV